MDFRARPQVCVVSAVLALAAGCRAPRAKTEALSYVDPALCAGCHPAIAKTYRETGMARAFGRPSAANTFAEGAAEPDYFHAPSRSYFAMIRRDGKYYQCRYQTGFDGKPSDVMEKDVHYVIGSGT
jgi:hypothetical protein